MKENLKEIQDKLDYLISRIKYHGESVEQTISLDELERLAQDIKYLGYDIDSIWSEGYDAGLQAATKEGDNV